MVKDKRLKMAIIAGASKALMYKAEDWKISDDEILRKVTREADKIIEKLDTE